MLYHIKLDTRYLSTCRRTSYRYHRFKITLFLLHPQVMYVTATSPYLLMTILLINGATLPGAAQGVKFYLIPDFNKIKEIQVRLTHT